MFTGRTKHSRCIVHLNRGDSGKHYWVEHIHLAHNHFQYILGDKCREVRNLFRNKNEIVKTGFLYSDPVMNLMLCCLHQKSPKWSLHILRGRQYKAWGENIRIFSLFFYLKNKKGITCFQYFICRLTLVLSVHMSWSWVMYKCEVC